MDKHSLRDASCHNRCNLTLEESSSGMASTVSFHHRPQLRPQSETSKQNGVIILRRWALAHWISWAALVS